MFSTIEDIYVACVETDRHQKEKIRFYDTAGLEPSKPELPKQYMSFADVSACIKPSTLLLLVAKLVKTK